MSERIQRINQLMRKELSQILAEELDLPASILVTLTRVETLIDLSYSNVFISVIPEKENKKVLGFLNRNVKKFQQKINARLKMRIVPKIHFIEEGKTKEAARIEEILEKIKREER